MSRTRLSDFPFTFHFHALEKEMATHSSVLAWRIPGMGETGGLLSTGSHRVGHDWSDLAAAAVCLYMCAYTFLYVRVFWWPWGTTSVFSFVPLCCSVTQSCLTLPPSWTAAHQASLPFTISQSLLKLMSIKLVMTYSHLVLCRPLLLLPSIFPSIRVFSNELALCIRWPKIGASASALPMNSQGWFPLQLTGLISLQSKGLSRVCDCGQKIKRHLLLCASPGR